MKFVASSYECQGTQLIVMVGCPASGKSTVRKRFLEPHGYVTVNRDTLGTVEKCAKVRRLLCGLDMYFLCS